MSNICKKSPNSLSTDFSRTISMKFKRLICLKFIHLTEFYLACLANILKSLQIIHLHLLEYFIEVQQTHSGEIYHDFLENGIIQLDNPHHIYHSIQFVGIKLTIFEPLFKIVFWCLSKCKENQSLTGKGLGLEIGTITPTTIYIDNIKMIRLSC